MRRRLPFGAAALSVLLLPRLASAGPRTGGGAAASLPVANADGGLVERNPGYRPPRDGRRRRRRKRRRGADRDGVDGPVDSLPEKDSEDGSSEDGSSEDGSSDDDDDELSDPSASTNTLMKSIRSTIAKRRSEIFVAAILLSLSRPAHHLAKQLLSPSALSPANVMKFVLMMDVLSKIFMGGGGLEGGSSVFSPPIRQSFAFERVNDRHFKDALALKKALDAPPAAAAPSLLSFVKKTRSDVASLKDAMPFSPVFFDLLSPSPPRCSLPAENRDETAPSPRHNGTVIVLEFKDPPTPSSPSAPPETLRSQIEFLRNAVSFLLLQRPALFSNETSLEALLILESPGGSAVEYGLASEQLRRLSREIPTTVCVDRVAASGGYMMASQASEGRLLAGRFAVVGSIGVISQAFNVHELLRRYGVSDMVFRGGKSKAPLGLFGEITDEGRDLVQGMVDRVHKAFRLIALNDNRNVAEENAEIVNGGEVFLGEEALRLGLIDGVLTSDEYIQEKLCEGKRVLRMVRCEARPRFGLFPWQLGVPLMKQGLEWTTRHWKNIVKAVLLEDARTTGVTSVANHVRGVNLGGCTII